MKDALIPQQASKYFCSSFTLILKDLSCVKWISANPCASSSFLSRTFSKFQIVNFWEQGPGTAAVRTPPIVLQLLKPSWREAGGFLGGSEGILPAAVSCAQ